MEEIKMSLLYSIVLFSATTYLKEDVRQMFIVERCGEKVVGTVSFDIH